MGWRTIHHFPSEATDLRYNRSAQEVRMGFWGCPNGQVRQPFSLLSYTSTSASNCIFVLPCIQNIAATNPGSHFGTLELVPRPRRAGFVFASLKLNAESRLFCDRAVPLSVIS